MTAEHGSDSQYIQVLETCLQELSAGTPIDELIDRHPDYSRRLGSDLAMAGWLRRQKTLFNPSADFLSEARSSVLLQIHVRPQPRPQPKPAIPPPAAAPRFGLAEFLRWLAGNRLAVQALSALLIVVLLLGSFSGVAFASQSSLPGESLYAVKTGVEDLRLLAVFDSVNDASLLLDFAGTRLDEMTLLVAARQVHYLEIPARRYTQQVDTALLDLSAAASSHNARQIQRASELASTLPAVLGAHAARLAGLADQTSPDGQPALQAAREFALQRQVASRQLIGVLDQASTVAITATATDESLAGGLSQPTGTAPGLSLPVPLAFTATPTLGFSSVTVASPLNPTTTSPFSPTATSVLAGSPPYATATAFVPAGGSTPQPSKEPTDAPPPATKTSKPPTSTPQPSDTPVPPSSTPQPSDTPEEQPTKKPSVTPRPTNTHRPTPLPTNPNRP